MEFLLNILSQHNQNIKPLAHELFFNSGRWGQPPHAFRIEIGESFLSVRSSIEPFSSERQQCFSSLYLYKGGFSLIPSWKTIDLPAIKGGSVSFECDLSCRHELRRLRSFLCPSPISKLIYTAAYEPIQAYGKLVKEIEELKGRQPIVSAGRSQDSLPFEIQTRLDAQSQIEQKLSSLYNTAIAESELISLNAGISNSVEEAAEHVQDLEELLRLYEEIKNRRMGLGNA